VLVQSNWFTSLKESAIGQAIGLEEWHKVLRSK